MKMIELGKFISLMTFVNPFFLVTNDFGVNLAIVLIRLNQNKESGCKAKHRQEIFGFALRDYGYSIWFYKRSDWKQAHGYGNIAR
jgi:hypothetical protein